MHFRLQRSTTVLIAVFVVTLAVYLLVRPDPASTRGVTPSVATPEPTVRTTTSTERTTSTTRAPETTSASTAAP